MTLGVRRIALTAVRALALVCVYAALASAQTTATVTGMVRDTGDENVAGATVALIGDDGGTPLQTETTGTGDFVLSSVPTGTYTIRVIAEGFSVLERKGVAVAVPPGDNRVVLGILTVEPGSSCK
jgi:hypothetical protein